MDKSLKLAEKSTCFSSLETKCLILLLKGYSLKMIADIMHLQPRTVEYYIHNMKQKLKVKTKLELILYAAQEPFAAEVWSSEFWYCQYGESDKLGSKSIAP